MSSLKPPTLSQGELFANNYPIITNAAVEQSIQQAFNAEHENGSPHTTHTHTHTEKSQTIPLTNFINQKSKLYQLTQHFNWQAISEQLGKSYRHNNSYYDTRQLAAMYAINTQNGDNYSLTLSLWLENPYWQFFCGMRDFQTQLPFDKEVLEGFTNHVRKTPITILQQLSNKLSHSGINSIRSFRKEQPKKLSKRSTKVQAESYETETILKPVFIKWYQDYLFYIYFLLAISFWVIYALIFPANWPNEALTWNQWKACLLIVIGFPIVEEIVFRGGLQTWLHHYNWAKQTSLHISVANVIVSIFFSSLHVILRADDPSTYGIIIPSLIFGLFRDRHKHIISCTLLHMFYNMGAFFLLILPTIK